MHSPVRTIIIKIDAQDTLSISDNGRLKPYWRSKKTFFTEICVNFPNFTLDLHLQFFRWTLEH